MCWLYVGRHLSFWLGDGRMVVARQPVGREVSAFTTV